MAWSGVETGETGEMSHTTTECSHSIYSVSRPLYSPQHVVQALLQRVALGDPRGEQRRDGELLRAGRGRGGRGRGVHRVREAARHQTRPRPGPRQRRGRGGGGGRGGLGAGRAGALAPQAGGQPGVPRLAGGVAGGVAAGARGVRPVGRAGRGGLLRPGEGGRPRPRQEGLLEVAAPGGDHLLVEGAEAGDRGLGAAWIRRVSNGGTLSAARGELIISDNSILLFLCLLFYFGPDFQFSFQI